MTSDLSFWLRRRQGIGIRMLALGILAAVTCSSVRGAESNGSEDPWSDVEAWMFEIESTVVSVLGKPPTKRRVTRRIFACRKPDKVYLFSGHNDRKNDEYWQREPFNVEFVLNGGHLTTHYKFNRSFNTRQIDRGGQIPRAISNDSLSFVLPTWPADHYAPPQYKRDQMVFVASNAILDAGYRCETESEFVRGVGCVKAVSPTGIDRIWYAEDRKFCVMRRDRCDPQTGRTLSRIQTENVEEVAPGLWMPTKFVSLQFDVSSVDSEPVVVSRSEHTIHDWKLNDEVPADLFEARLLPGSIRSTASSFEQELPGGLDHLDDVAWFVKENGGNRAQGAKNGVWWPLTLGIASGIAVGVFVSVSRKWW